MEKFTTIKFEYFSAGAWVDFTADVLATPNPRMDGMGILSTSVLDRVGNVATLTFSVNNSATGSRGLGGYSTLFTTGTQVHVYFEYDGIRRYKYFGYVEKGGVNVITGQYRDRRVDVRCTNFMAAAAAHDLDLIGYALNKTMNEGVQLVINNMARQPQAYKYQTGSTKSQTFPTLFDVTRTTTKSIGEFQKMAMSEWGRVYVSADGQTGERLTTEGNYTRTDFTAAYGDIVTVPVKSSDVTDALLLANGVDNLLLMATGNLKLNNTQSADFNDADFSDMVISYSDDKTMNRLVLNLLPRTVDAASTNVLWALDEPIELAAGAEKLDLRGTYRDPDNLDTKINGIDMTPPVATTDYQAFQNSDGTGTDYTTSLSVAATFGTADVSYNLKNNAAVTVYVTRLQARGKGVRIYNINPIVYNSNSGQQSRFGVLTQTVEMPYIASQASISDIFTVNPLDGTSGRLRFYTVDYAKIESATLIANRDSLSMFAFMCLEPGVPIAISETLTVASTSAGYFLNGYSWTIKPGGIVEWTGTFSTRGTE